jgi:hypothetical protein
VCDQFRQSSIKSGRLAQLVEHLVYTERVGGSSPSPPTNKIKDLYLKTARGRSPKTELANHLANNPQAYHAALTGFPIVRDGLRRTVARTIR